MFSFTNLTVPTPWAALSTRPTLSPSTGLWGATSPVDPTPRASGGGGRMNGYSHLLKGDFEACLQIPRAWMTQ
eukprot:7382091-Prymnesium_polylepis.1